jgi:hypothetical protein
MVDRYIMLLSGVRKVAVECGENLVKSPGEVANGCDR